VIAPSGEQFEIVRRDQRAVVVEVGGGLRAYSVAGRELLDGYGVDEMCPKRWEFLFVAAPLRIVGGTGSPLNPIAIF
jgi:aldose 1-epimerase